MSKKLIKALFLVPFLLFSFSCQKEDGLSNEKESVNLEENSNKEKEKNTKAKDENSKTKENEEKTEKKKEKDKDKKEKTQKKHKENNEILGGLDEGKQNWYKDILQFEKDINWYNVSPFEKLGEENFYKAYNELISKLKDYSIKKIEWEFRKLVFSLGDGHIDIWRVGENDSTLPIMIGKLEEGYFIVNAKKEYAHLIGERVDTIEGKKIEELISLFREVSNSENKYWNHTQAIDKLHFFYFYELAEIIDEGKSFLMVNSHEIPKIETYANLDENNWVNGIKLYNTPNSVISYSAKQKKPYSYSLDANNKIMKVVFSSAQAEIKEQGIIQFGEEVKKQMLKHRPQILIFDLRGNTGGSSASFTTGFPAKFFVETGFDNGRNLYIATDNGTFSAGAVTVRMLKQNYQAEQIGEETGGSAFTTNVSKTAQKTLENSGLNFRISSAKISKKMINNPTELPDTVIIRSKTDLLEKLDPIMEFLYMKLGA